MNFKNTLDQYTESEYTALIQRLFDGYYSSEAELDEIVENIVNTSEHPSGSDILYFPSNGIEDSPAGVLMTIKQWRAANGKPGFKTE
jgi:hypothetical protein